MINARQLWLQIHRYLALALGAFIALISLTGSILTFHPEIERALNPGLETIGAGPVKVSLDDAIAAVTRHAPVAPGLLWLPSTDNKTFTVESYEASTDTYWITSVDGITGDILGHREWGLTFTTFLLRFHATLLLGDGGLTFVSILAVVLIFSVLSGMYLWWPKQLFNRRAFVPRLTKTPFIVNFETHRLLGLYLLPAILLIAVSAVSFGFPQAFANVVGWFSATSIDPEDRAVAVSAPSDGSSHLSLTELHNRALAALPNSNVALLLLPQSAGDALKVDAVANGEPASRHGLSRLWLDPYTGRELARHVYADLNTGDRFLALQLPLHAGVYFGMPGKIIAVLSGIAIVTLYITGLYLWWKRRPKRPRARSRFDASEQTQLSR